MVKVKEKSIVDENGQIDLERWLTDLAHKGYFEHIDKIRHACNLTQLASGEHATETGESCLKLGLDMADILADLEVDPESIIAAIIFESVHYAELSVDDVSEQLGEPIARLIRGIIKMSAMNQFQTIEHYARHRDQIDNVRKMLLAMVDDARVVLIKLAERLCLLRSAINLPESMRVFMAKEAMEIYAPLANRLGIGAIKWEMEDLAFRHLYPDDYKSIAKGLKARRLDRDRYVDLVVDELNTQLRDMGLSHFAVYGRSKHIHSIYKKMQRKNVPLEEIYDATAVRILVDTKEQCYEVLAVVHGLWQQIPAEFDDYINHPKANGYQSLHTAVTGPENRVFEVQIRTFHMHDFAEMGVAAHWKYKEGAVSAKESHERKIAWLRDVLSWHREMAENKGVSPEVEREFLEDRVYVFTPDTDVLDLPNGSTPLDFAYHIHSQIGHRCRGAKINGQIVNLSYQLKTGDRVEILTGKEAKPSRDWLSPQQQYLKTSRAKAKVLHWFKMQDYDRNREEGHAILEKELKTLGVKSDALTDIIGLFNFKTVDDLYAAVGRNDIKIGQIISKLQPHQQVDPIANIPQKANINIDEQLRGDLRIEGVGNLLTHMAKCCQPLPGDDVIGYITLGRGVSIHRRDCPNMTHATERQKERFLSVHWGMQVHKPYPVDIIIKAYDRHDLIKDITSLMAHEKAMIHALHTYVNKKDNSASINLTINVDGLDTLSKLLGKIEQIPNVIEARRQA